MKRVRIESLRSFAVVFSALIAGCAGGSAENFYALNDGAIVQSTTSGRGARGPSLPGIVVSAVTVPELVDRPQIVTRDVTNRVIVSEQNLWAEPIRSGISRTLATRLSRALEEAGTPAQVAAYPQTSIATPVLRVTIDVVRFDAVPNGEAVIDAVWSVRRVSDGMVRTGRTAASSPISGTSYDAIVHSWNQAIAIVDRDIAAMVMQVGVGATPAR
jgi:uncharacterized lipoprotein YmbA